MMLDERLAEAGSLMVEVVSAANLIAMDRGGSSDPYCSVKLGRKKGCTKSVKKSLNPRWNETLTFSGKLGEVPRPAPPCTPCHPCSESPGPDAISPDALLPAVRCSPASCCSG